MIDHRSEIEALLEQIAKEQGFTTEITPNDHVELVICLRDPNTSQEVLTVNLQNADELHLFIRNFWGEWYPFPEIKDQFRSALEAWLKREARLVSYWRGKRLLKIKLQLHEGDGWQTVFTDYKTILLPFFSTHQTIELR